MWTKIKKFFLKIKPSKRKLIQLYAALLYNANIKGFITGKIYTGSSKSVCLPGMNCYSCPGAIGACPLGSLQNALSESKTKAPTYVLGILLLYCITLGRTICGFLCPAGFLQELLYKIKTPKLKKNKVTRILSYFKYVLLFVLVIAIPLIYGLQAHNIPLPAFCKYICPVGTFEGAVFLLVPKSNAGLYGMLGGLFTWKFALLIVFIVASIFIFRFFCRFFCPLGALYGLFNKLAIIGVKVDKSKCTHCNACVNFCKMDIKEVGDHECIQCGECRSVCKVDAISWKTIGALIEKEKEEEQAGVEVEALEEPKAVKPKRKVNKRMLYGGITTAIMLGFLIFVFIFYNVDTGKKQFGINEVCDELQVKLYSDEEFDITQNDQATILYFYTAFDQEAIQFLSQYEKEKLNIVAIGTYEQRQSDQERVEQLFAGTQLIFGYDSVNSTSIRTFTNEEAYPYYVFLDAQDKVLIKSSSFTEKEMNRIVYPSLSGLQFGNQVGNLCLGSDIKLIGQDGTFNVLDQHGKITILNFWGTWCTPCVMELPYFDEVQKKYPNDVTVLAIHDGTSYDQNVPDYIASNWSEFSILFGYDTKSSTDLSEYYQALGGDQTWPMTIIVDQNGVIQVARQGSINLNELTEYIENLL